MKLIQPQLYLQPHSSRRRRRWSRTLIILAFLQLFIQWIAFVSGFICWPRYVPLITSTAVPSQCRCSTIDRKPWYMEKNCQRAFIKLQRNRQQQQQTLQLHMQYSDVSTNATSSSSASPTTPNATRMSSPRIYDLGVGKHSPLNSTTTANMVTSDTDDQPFHNTTNINVEQESSLTTNNNSSILNARLIGMHWMVPESVVKPSYLSSTIQSDVKTTVTSNQDSTSQQLLPQDSSILNQIQLMTKTEKKSRRMVARDNEGQTLRGALWDEQHYDLRGNNRNIGMLDNTDTNGAEPMSKQQVFSEWNNNNPNDNPAPTKQSANIYYNKNYEPPYPKAFYPDIDLSIPDSVYSDDVDLVWDLLRYEAYQNQQEQHEPLLVSFLHSTILNHDTLESSLAFLLANRLQSPAMMISTQLQALILSALQDCAQFRRKLRADIMAVRDRDPACHTLPDVFLYFKGFHALQSYRTAHVLWNSGRTILAQYLQSQVSQIFQIDIHPNATIGSGIMLDHGTGIVIGETATVGHNCSILHHVTLGGSGKKGIIRHPAVGNGVLLGAGATVLGPITIGDGCQVGAGTLVISDLPPHCVAVGVPARIIGSFVDVTEQPSIGMDQIMESRDKIITFESDGI